MEKLPDGVVTFLLSDVVNRQATGDSSPRATRSKEPLQPNSRDYRTLSTPKSIRQHGRQDPPRTIEWWPKS